MEKDNIIIKKGLSIFKCLGIILLFLLFPAMFFVIFNIDAEKIPDSKYVLYLTLANFILLGIFIFIYRKDLIENIKAFGKNIGGNLELSFKYWLAGFAIMVVSNLFITFILQKTIAGNEDTVRNFINTSPFLMIIETVFIAPVIEELTFRKSIREAINHKWIYVLVSGFVFGLLHVISYITSWLDLIYLIPYCALGISFALLYYRTNNIFSTISVHALHNFLAILVYLLGVGL